MLNTFVLGEKGTFENSAVINSDFWDTDFRIILLEFG